MNSLNQQIKLLFTEQTTNWAQAKESYSNLARVQTKSVSFGDFEVKVQFNPARIVSSGAKVDAKTIAARKCFLCTENRPAGQTSVDAGDYLILVNPFPIFPEHFTIPRKEHVDQQIKPYFADMLELARALDDYLVFYNGPRCGASAPDHMHFQAGTKNFLPLVNDYKRLKPTHAELLDESEHYQMYSLKNYRRTVYCIESDNIVSAQKLFENCYIEWQKNEPKMEPMMNIVCSFEDGIWYTFLIPRATFRPWQYSAEGNQQLMVSPATVEMCGIFITPIETHFEQITKEDVVSILEQASWGM
jgi:ATP adenylyltransferase (5'',5''''''-P-1,P-4-tetraphosphate phosphorylase II)